MSSSRPKSIRVAADLYKGVPRAAVKDSGGGDVELEPTVLLKKDEHFNVKLDMSDPLAKRLTRDVKHGKVSISLGALDVDLQHNQSFGMVAASTGCISNPGGPSC